jgi:hypothetical protein
MIGGPQEWAPRSEGYAVPVGEGRLGPRNPIGERHGFADGVPRESPEA